MKPFVFVIALLLTFFVPVVSAQKGDDLRQKYGAPDEKGRYHVRPNIGMKVETSEDGRPSRAIIQRLDIDDFPRWDNPKLMPTEEAQAVIAEVVPVSKRGKLRGTGRFAFSCIGSQVWHYDQVTITVDTRCEAQGGGTYDAVVHWK